MPTNNARDKGHFVSIFSLDVIRYLTYITLCKIISWFGRKDVHL